MTATGFGPTVGAAILGAVVLGGLLVARAGYALGQRRVAVVAVGGVRGDAVPDDLWARCSARARRRVPTLAPVRWWVARRVVAERARLLPEFVDAVARSLDGGGSLRGALVEGGEATGEPFAADMARVEARNAGGQSLVDALDRWAADLGHDDARLFATACRLGAESGRGTADALSGVADTLADRRDVAAESQALASQAKASAVMLTLLPVVVCIGTAFVDPASTTTLLTTPLGLGCLAVGAGLDVAGAWWMHRMIGAVT